MTVRPPRSLQARLLTLLLPGLVLLWVLAGVATWLDARHELDELLDSHLAQAAALLVVQHLGEPGGDDHREVQAPLLHRYAPRSAFQVWHDGRLVLRSTNTPATAMSDHASGFRTLKIDGKKWRVFATRGAERDVQVFVAEQVESRDDILKAVLRSLLPPAVAALPLLALAGWWSVRRGLAPLRALSEQLRQRQPQALQPLQLQGTPTEMVPLVDALNGLFARIATMVETERRFTADAAHELRTPIAAIRTQAQVALAAAEDVERRHALAQTLAGCDRATRLVQQLLMLSQLEAGPGEAATAVVDLAALARRVAADLGRDALARGQQLELQAERSGPVHGDEVLLGVLLRNLLDNALRYSPAGARIRVTVGNEGGSTRLCVADSGPGLSDADRQRLGERFFRVLGGDAPGSGLDWSIVRRIAATQGATLHSGRSADLGGLEVVVVWPSGPAAVS